jgi:hypothetical protein
MKKGLICIIGESFRLGGQGTRVRDVDEAYEPQKSASMSVVEFADHIKAAHGVDCDMVVSSYSTRWEGDLKEWYGHRLIGSTFRESLVGLERLVSEAKNIVDFSTYDFILVLRIDLLLKPFFKTVFNPHWDSVMYPSVCWLGWHEVWGQPRASDMMVHVPKRLVSAPFHMSHEACFHYAKEGFGSDFGFMLDTLHDSDSAKDYNPLYRIVGRPASERWHSVGYKMDARFMPISSELRSFPDWSPRSMLRADKRDVSVEGLWEWWHKNPGQSFFQFIDLIGFYSHDVFGNIVEHYDNPDQRYWSLECDEMVIFHENRRVSSRLKKVSEYSYRGLYEFNRDIEFMIKKTNTRVWN